MKSLQPPPSHLKRLTINSCTFKLYSRPTYNGNRWSYLGTAFYIAITMFSLKNDLLLFLVYYLYINKNYYIREWCFRCLNITFSSKFRKISQFHFLPLTVNSYNHLKRTFLFAYT